MSAAITEIMIELRMLILRACLLLMTITFLSSGFLPQPLHYLELNYLELAEQGETDKETEGKEEREKDNYLIELSHEGVWHSKGTQTFSRDFCYWYRSYMDVFTPPPEQV